MAKNRMGPEAQELMRDTPAPGAKTWKDAVGGKASAPATVSSARTVSVLFKIEPDQRRALREAALLAAADGGRVDASRIVRHLIDEWITAGSPLPPAE